MAVTALDAPFELSEPQARRLAHEFGTPLYVLDEATLVHRATSFLAAARSAYPRSTVSFASKANSISAVLQLVHRAGCGIDVASEGELRAALHGGVPPRDCHLHGNFKSDAELAAALELGIGRIVVDSLYELDQLQELKSRWGSTRFLLRLAPGVDPETHAKISTGQADTKFGFNITDGSAEEALRQALALGLPVDGFHCHVGSQILNAEAQRAGGEALARFAVAMKGRHGFETRLLVVGGGLGIRYAPEDRPPDLGEYCRSVAAAVLDPLSGSGLEPELGHEPGRAIVGEAGATLYTVGPVKDVPVPGGTRRYAAVDGGLSDNPRPALYGARYPVSRVARSESAAWTYATDGPGAAFGDPLALEERPTTVAGRHCETDTLFEGVALPGDLAPGDLLQVQCTGAYNASMASNYNRFPRPAAVLLRPDGSAVLVQRREAFDDLLQREVLPAE